MKLGLFSMPLHRPEKPFLQTLEEDREAILLADRLGYSEAWIGEHFTSKVEQIASPLIFLATLIHETRSIRFGTGVINIPHHHPVTVASHVAPMHSAKRSTVAGVIGTMMNAAAKIVRRV